MRALRDEDKNVALSRSIVQKLRLDPNKKSFSLTAALFAQHRLMGNLGNVANDKF